MAVVSENKERSYDGDYKDEGEFAERVALEYFKSNPSVIGVMDFRDLRLYQDIDVDFGLSLVNGTNPLVEIKSDNHLGITGNVLYEVLRINHTCRPDKSCTLGWSVRSSANYFVYFAPSKDELWICEANELRQVFQKYTHETRNQTRFKWINTDNIKSTYCILIPVELCQDIFSIRNVSEIVKRLKGNGVEL